MLGPDFGAVIDYSWPGRSACLIDGEKVPAAVRALHKAFELEG